LLFRPVVRLENRIIAGFEALTLWEHPQIGRMSPFELVAMAEEIGLVGDLARYTIEHSARQLSLWQRAARQRLPLFTSIGISSRQLLRSDVVDMLRTVIARAGLARGTLKLELTEAALMENPEQATQILKRLREYGAGLTLGNFGTGHSSLAYLSRFSLDTIKIDRSFVRPNAKGARPAVLRSIIGLAHDVGMAVLAEGAEAESDVGELYHLGCEFAQGPAFGRPMSGEEAQELVLGKRLETVR
jgi:EAL domain-containing protein (putative c-di-GMP-specific phosphodiesterase class I)